MAKFNIKAVGKNALTALKTDGVNIAATTAGVIGTQKFLDFKTLFPNVDPKNPFIEHEGFVKIGGVLLAVSLFPKMPMWAKCLLYGMAIQGAIKSVRKHTMNPEGKAFVEQIGAGEFDAQIKAMADEIKKTSNMNGITNNSYSAVSGIGNPTASPTVSLITNSQTAVSGMGFNEDEGNFYN